MAVDKDFAIVISKANMIGDDIQWWIDSGATWYIARNMSLFKTYEEDCIEGELFVGNSSTTKVKGKRQDDSTTEI